MRTRLVTASLGAAGLLCAGPLPATLLVGRTGAIPSLRWLGVCVVTWVVLGALSWATAQGSRRRALQALAPTASLSVFLPWAYADDQVFHALTRSTWQTLGSLSVLAVLGVGASNLERVTGRTVIPRASRDRVAPADRRPAAYVGGADPSQARDDARVAASPTLVSAIVGLSLMYGLNDVIFEPLGAPPAGPLAPLRFLAGVLPALILAALVWARLLGARDVAALAAAAGVSGFLAVWLGVAPAGPALFAIAAAGLVAVAQDSFWSGLGGRARSLAVAALVIGVALAATDMPKYGLGARELVAAAPELARLLPALGPLAAAAALALGVVGQTSRSAAMGGMREA